jgi:hypothetical protein
MAIKQNTTIKIKPKVNQPAQAAFTNPTQTQPSQPPQVTPTVQNKILQTNNRPLGGFAQSVRLAQTGSELHKAIIG